MPHELTQLKERLIRGLAEYPLRILAEVWGDNALGSGYFEIGRNAPEFRLIWDGKDGWGYLQHADDGQWVVISGYISEGDFLHGAPDESKVSAMVAAAAFAITR